MIGDLISVLFLSNRSIGGIIPDVTIEEHHTDTMHITDHPVEYGAAISDHAYKLPSEVTMHIGWSNASTLLSQIVTGSIFSGQMADINDLYGQILDLQASRIPFDLVTGKRTYSNMLIKMVENNTNKETENCLILAVHMKQVIITDTQTVTIAPADQHVDPQRTAPVLNSGTKQPVLAPQQSILKQIFG